MEIEKKPKIRRDRGPISNKDFCFKFKAEGKRDDGRKGNKKAHKQANKVEDEKAGIRLDFSSFPASQTLSV